jgi:STE24 endopeptidase
MQSFNVEQAVSGYLATVSGAARANSNAYFEGGYWIILWSALIAIGIFWMLLHFGIASRLARWADRVTGNRPALSSLVFALPYAILVELLTLPWDIYIDYAREHRYGLSNQAFGEWFGEWVIGTIVDAVFLAIIVVTVLAIVRKTLERWWVWSSMAVIAIMIFAIAIAPVAIAPLFNDYTPMPEGAVKAQVLAMARANGVAADNVYVVDQSRQSDRISANVQGLGPTVRISLNDNLLNKSTPAEIRSVMGHELGHYVLNHLWKLIGFLTLLILALFGFVNWLMPWMIARWGGRWGVLHGADTVTVPMGGILVTLFILVATPLTNSLIRVQEQEADLFGLNAARAPDGFARVAMKLSTYRKLEPGKWEEIIFFDHPSGRVRAETAMRWKAEHLGEPGVE